MEASGQPHSFPCSSPLHGERLRPVSCPAMLSNIQSSGCNLDTDHEAGSLWLDTEDWDVFGAVMNAQSVGVQMNRSAPGVYGRERSWQAQQWSPPGAEQQRMHMAAKAWNLPVTAVCQTRTFSAHTICLGHLFLDSWKFSHCKTKNGAQSRLRGFC
jgi:hypothetical protein